MRSRAASVPTLVLLLLALAPFPAGAQETPPAPSASPGRARLAEQAEQAGKALDANDMKSAAAALGLEEIAEGAKDDWQAAVTRRKQLLGELDSVEKERRELPDAESLQDQIAKAKQEAGKKEAQAEGDVPLDARQDLKALEAAVKAETNEADAAARTARERLDELSRQQAEDEKLLSSLPDRISDLESAGAEGEPTDDLGRFRRKNDELELELARDRLDVVKTRRALGDARSSLQEARLAAAQAAKKLARAKDQKLEEWKKTDLLRQRVERKAGLDEAEQKLEAASSPEDRIRALVAREIAEVRLTTVEDQLHEQQFKAALDDAEERNDRLKRTEDRLERRFSGEQRGASDQTAKILLSTLSLRRRLQAEMSQDLQPELDRWLSDFYDRRAAVQDRLWNLWELDSPLHEIPEDYQKAIDATDAGPAREQARELYRQERKQVEDAYKARESAVGEGVATLEELDEAYATRRRVLEDLYTFVIRRIYWVRNAEPLDFEQLSAIPDEVGVLLRIYESPTLWESTARAMSGATWRWAVTALGFVLLLGLAVFLLRKLGDPGSRRTFRGGPFLGGLQRIVVAIAVAALAPACLALAALLLTVLRFPSELQAPAVHLLVGFAAIYFLRRLLRSFCSEEGILVRQLGVTAEAAAQLTTASRWVIAGLLFLALPYVVLGSLEVNLSVIRRLLYTAMLVWFSIVLLSLLRRNGALVRATTSETGFWYRAWGAVWFVLAAGLAVIVGMHLFGYQRGSELLTENVLQTLVAVVVLVGLYRLLTGLVQKAAVHFRQRNRGEPGTGNAWEESQEVLHQASRVVGAALIVATVLLLASFWGVLDGLKSVLGDVRLTEVRPEEYLTLWDVLKAALYVMGGHFLLANLRGLLETLVFPRMRRVDAGTRYVIVTVTKYVVFLVAYASAILTLHFSFESLGWLLAAASVGLGFGLQEIVANFVSGLILFFERPIKVGDVVTVGTISGTVDRINIRATHVVNWDRQVNIIPNRKFIEEDVINWAHNDLVVRTGLFVGIAYGGDVKKAKEILLDVVRNHPKVKKTPEPKFHFYEFGDSSLNLRVWFFTDIDDRFGVLTELNSEVHERFNEAGVEIPFPQRDLHVRSVLDDNLETSLRRRLQAEGVPLESPAEE